MPKPITTEHCCFCEDPTAATTGFYRIKYGHVHKVEPLKMPTCELHFSLFMDPDDFYTEAEALAFLVQESLCSYPNQ